MLASIRGLRTRLIGGSAAIAAFSLSVFGIAAAEGQAASEYQATNVEDLSPLKDRALKCDSVGYKSTKFVFGDQSRQIREIRMCTKENGNEVFADVQHLGSELMRASNAYRDDEPQSAGLAHSRDPQARTVNNHSAPVGDHVKRPASFEEIVKELEAELSSRSD